MVGPSTVYIHCKACNKVARKTRGCVRDLSDKMHHVCDECEATYTMMSKILIKDEDVLS